MGALLPPHRLLSLLTPGARGSITVDDDGYQLLGAFLAQPAADPPLNPATADASVLIGWPPPRLQPPKLSFYASPFGRTPYNLMMMLGVESVLVEAAVRQIRPPCARCGGATERPAPFTLEQLPAQGWIAVVVRDGVDDIPLRERCELLGTERAYVAGRLLRVTDDATPPDAVEAVQGEPVLLLESAERFRRNPSALEGWFARGGGRVVLVHFSARDGVGVELGVRARGLTCTGCGGEVAAVHRADLDALPPCAQCNGAGWLEAQPGELTACVVCGGFGSSAPLTTARCGRWQVRDLLAVTVEEFFAHLPELTPNERALGAELCAAGLGGYPLGYPVARVSPTERLCFALAVARRTGVRGALFVADSPALPGLQVPGEEGPAWLSAGEPTCVQYTPAVKGELSPLPAASAAGACLVELREAGPFIRTALQFPCAAATLIQGAAGTGKSLVLSEVQRLFAQRRRLAQHCSFPGLKRLSWIASFEPLGSSVLEALSIWPAIAALVVRSRHAQRLGLDQREVEAAHQRHPCPECSEGLGALSIDRAEDTVCQSCFGTGLHPRLLQLPLGGAGSVGQLLTGTLAEAAELLWSDDELSAVFAAIPVALHAQLRLITPLHRCIPAQVRCVRVCAGLGRVLARAEGRRGAAGAEELVLLDTPFAVPGTHLEQIIQLCTQLLTRRVTLLCAGAAVALESLFHHVVHLEAAPAPLEDRLAAHTLESRLGRRSTVRSGAGRWGGAGQRGASPEKQRTNGTK